MTIFYGEPFQKLHSINVMTVGITLDRVTRGILPLHMIDKHDTRRQQRGSMTGVVFVQYCVILYSWCFRYWLS